MEDRIKMSEREIDRLGILREVERERIRQTRAAEMLRLSVRQVRRLLGRIKAEGARGLAHRLRGRASNRRIALEVKERTLERIRERYEDFGPTLAHEKLKEPVSRETVRAWMVEAGLHRSRRRPPPHRQWRPRREHVGELVQLDGSIHDWFEDRGERCVLVAYIDDATSRVMHAAFVPTEDTFHLFRTTKAYLEAHGRPLAFYVDRDSIYRVNRQATVEEELQEAPPMTQYGRAMRQLGIELIPAFSPQAKGRVERLFGTLQDRLVKELRLKGISTIAAANRFLRETYLAAHNARFSRLPARSANAHRRILHRQNLDSILAFHTPRVVHNDYTVQYQGRFFQLEASQPCRIRSRNVILIEHRLDGSVHLRYKAFPLNAHRIAKRNPRPWNPTVYGGPASHKPGTLNYARNTYIAP